MRTRPTIVEVAAALGVAPSTVSRAFNAPGRLRPETVLRILQKAEELGYTPNEHARALITGKSGALGFIVPDITNPFFPPMVRAAQHAAERRDLGVFIADTEGQRQREEAMIRRLLPKVEGLVIASSRLSHKRLREIGRQRPVVLINSEVPGLSRVMLSSAVAIAAAVNDLYRAGHRNFAYVGGPAATWSEEERSQAFIKEVERLGVSYARVRAAEGRYDEARALVDELVASAPTAVIAFDDVLAHGVLDGLTALGIHVPEDVQLLGCDDALQIQTGKRMSTITLPTGLAASEAVRLLYEADPSAGGSEARLELQGSLRYRATTSCGPALLSSTTAAQQST